MVFMSSPRKQETQHLPFAGRELGDARRDLGASRLRLAAELVHRQCLADAVEEHRRTNGFL
jgi:hypothetical protein